MAICSADHQAEDNLSTNEINQKANDNQRWLSKYGAL